MPKESKKLIKMFLSLTSLILISLFPSTSLCFECKDLNDFEQEDKNKILYFSQIKDDLDQRGKHSEYFKNVIGKGSFGTVVIDSNDPTKVVKLQKIDAKNDSDLLNEIDISLKFSERDVQLEGQYRVAPRIDLSYCLNMKKKKKFVPISGERFRGDLTNAIIDPRFILSMRKTSHRFEFYRRMMLAFSEIAKLKYKHCDLKPENLLYKEENANFEADYNSQEEELTFFPVVTDFGMTVPWGDECVGGTTGYTDPEDFNNTKTFTPQFRACTEIFSMSIIILAVETGILTQLAKQYPDQNRELVNELNKFPQVPHMKDNDEEDEELKLLSKISLYKNYKFLVSVIEAWNSKKIKDFNHSKFINVLGYVLSGAKVYQEFFWRQSGMEEEKISQMLGVYDSFVKILLEMVRKNDMMTTKQRPNVNEVISTLSTCKENSEAIENGRRRTLVMI